MRPNVQTALNRTLTLAALGCALFSGSRAYAGPIEQMVEVAAPPGKSDAMVVRYLNGGGGVFFSGDSGKTWALQCNSAFLGMGGKVQGPMAVLPDKSFLALTSAGVVHADANGCGFKVESADVTKNIVDFAQHPTDPMKLIAAVSNPTGMSGLVQRAADGTWSDYGVKDMLSPVSVRAVAKGSAVRIYEIVVKQSTSMATAGTGAVSTEYLLRVSDDEAKTWQEYPLPPDSKMGRPRLRAVDPSNTDRLVISMDRQMERDELLVSKDGGKTTSKYMDLDDFGGIAFAPDGRVWIGDLGLISGASMSRGLYAAANLDAMPERLAMAMYPVQCLGWAEDTKTLYACQRFWFGTVNQMTGEFTTTLRFNDVPKFVSCPGEDPAMECKQQLCLDYCGPAHFAAAPVCSAYDQPDCGKPVALMEAESDGSTVGASGTGAAGSSAGSSGAAGSVSSTAGSSGSSAAGQSAGGTGGSDKAGSTPPEKSDSGCSCTVPGASGSSNVPMGLALSALAWVVVLRRRRSRSAR